MAYVNKEGMMFVENFNITLYPAWNREKFLCGVILEKFSSDDVCVGKGAIYMKKIDIYINKKYVCTTFNNTCKEAIENFKENPYVYTLNGYQYIYINDKDKITARIVK